MYEKTVLSNGLRIITHDMKERESVAVGIWVDVGGRHEDDRKKGAAHFLEHILFKGSKKYSGEEIKKQIEGVGGSLNAFTSEEQTCFYAKVPFKYLNKAFDVLSDMVVSPLIAKKDVDKERMVILEEIKMYRDLPQYYVLELLDELMWPNHPLGKGLAGTFESVGSMSNQDLQAFHKGQYFPGNIVISACGHLRDGRFDHLVQEKLGKFADKQKQGCMPFKNTQQKPKANFLNKNTEQMHLALGMFGLDYDHKDKYAFGLLNVILGGNMSSRLFNEVREKRGLAYSISSSAKALKDTGMFMIRAGVDNKKIAETLEVILKELKKIKRNGVNKDEFVRARDYFLGQFSLGLEDTLDHMLWIGESIMVRNKMRTMQDIISRVKKINMDDIQRVASQIFQERHFNLSLIGPVTDKQRKKLGVLIGL